MAFLKSSSKDVIALSASSALPNRVVTKENIINIVLENDIDSVIVARLIATKKESVTTEKKSELIFEQPSPEKLSEAVVINYQHVASERVTDTTATVLLSADLYSTDRESDNRVWGIQFLVEDKKSQSEILDNAVDLISKKLAADGLIK